MAMFELDLPTGVVAHSLKDPHQQACILAQTVADALRFAIQTEGRASLVVPGGESVLTFFERLAEQELDWSCVTVTLTDERWVPPQHADSNERRVRSHLLRGRAASARFIGLYHAAVDLDRAADAAHQALAELQRPIDVVVLGMGEDGHTASLFSGEPLLRHALDPQCPVWCLPMHAPQEPKQRISLTYAVLASARLLCLAVQGHGKFLTLSRALHATPLQMPIHAFLRYPLEIYWCP